MPTPLTPSSSQEIIPISPPPYADHKGKGKRKAVDEAATTLPRAKRFEPAPDLKRRVGETLKQQRKQEDGQYGKRKARSYEVENERQETEGMSRSRQTERMLATRGKDVNPITNSDLYSRTDHFVSASTGHQQSNRGGGSAGARTYWEVRNAKMKEQAREQKTEVLKGCVFYINGSTGPRVSNLQLQHMITANGGRFTATQNSSCTHIIASGGLSGTKTQKWINGQGSGRGGARRLKVVRVDWVLDSVEQGIRLSEAGYDVVKDPSQQNLFSAFGAIPKAELRAKGEP